MNKHLEHLEEEIFNLQNKSDIIVKCIHIDNKFSITILDHSKFSLAEKSEYRSEGFYGSFFGIDVFIDESVSKYNVKAVEDNKICKDCYCEMLYDDVYTEYYCPHCEETS
jgi:hypothetical protein